MTSFRVRGLDAAVNAAASKTVQSIVRKSARRSRALSMIHHARPLLEALERRQLLTTVLSETFEGAFPEDNGWTVNLDQDRTWDDTNYKAHSGSWSGFCAEYQGADSTNTYVDNLDTYMEKTVDL